MNLYFENLLWKGAEVDVVFWAQFNLPYYNFLMN